MKGDTLMKAPTGEDAVNNDYRSVNILVSRGWGDHRLKFSI